MLSSSLVLVWPRGALALAAAALLAAVAGCAAPASTPVLPAATPAAPATQPAAHQGQEVRFAGAGGDMLRAHWFPAPAPVSSSAASPAPAIVALHGCGGLYTARGTLGARYREVVARWQAAGYAVLLPDSLHARGAKTACIATPGQRHVTSQLRVGDTVAALEWLSQQPGVDQRRLGLMGWSQGGSTSLQTLESAAFQARVPPLAGMVVYYPGCGGLLKRQVSPGAVPLLMLLGEKDDWTPPQSCMDWNQHLQTLPGVSVDMQVYADSYHGFDSKEPVRVRQDILRGKPPQPVHQGGNPQARAASMARVDAFWQRVFERSKERP